MAHGFPIENALGVSNSRFDRDNDENKDGGWMVDSELSYQLILRWHMVFP